jgi:hypothetical protein
MTPLDSDYSRVTRPERFAGLHSLARWWADQTVVLYDVDREEGVGLAREIESDQPSRGAIALRPRNVGAAPLVLVFTSFPGILLRAGRWHSAAFPACGCDACNEQLDDDSRRLMWVLDAIVSGRFREAIERPSREEAWVGAELWSEVSQASERRRLTPGEADQLLAGRADATVQWSPWARRNFRSPS